MLADRHVALLAARAVTGDVVERRGYRSVVGRRDLVGLGFPEGQVKKYGLGLLIPRYGLDGRPTWPQFRPDPEFHNGCPLKYVAPGGSWNFVDALPGTRLQGSREVWLSAEGPIKADAMTAASGLPVISIAGVYGWRSSGDVVLGLEVLADRGRWFHLVCDSDIDTNPRVAGAMFRLAAWLRSRGCKARILHPPGQQKVGVDDYLAAGGHLSTLVQASRPTATVRRAWVCRRAASAWT